MAGRGRLLLTGGSGMVGTNIQEHPLAAEWEMLAPGRAELDLTDAGTVRDFMARHKPDVVVHAAGRVGGIQAKTAYPVAFLDQNLTIGRNVIMGAHAVGVERLINLSSTSVYPRDAASPLTENMILTGPLEPLDEGYALAKIAATRLCQYLCRELPNLQYKTLIPCSLYGPHDTFDPQTSHLIPAIIHKVHTARRTGSDSVEIWGDGTARREIIYAPDLAEAILKAAAEIEALPDLMNIGPGRDHTIGEFYRIVADVVGWHGRFTHDLTRPVGLKRRLSSTVRQSEWGWTAPTPLIDGIAQTYRYYLKKARA